MELGKTCAAGSHLWLFHGFSHCPVDWLKVTTGATGPCHGNFTSSAARAIRSSCALTSANSPCGVGTRKSTRSRWEVHGKSMGSPWEVHGTSRMIFPATAATAARDEALCQLKFARDFALLHLGCDRDEACQAYQGLDTTFQYRSWAALKRF